MIWNSSVAIFLTLCLSTMGVGVEPEPARAEPVYFNAGSVFPGETLHHTFQVANSDREAWPILTTITSCSCAAAELSGREIPAAGTLPVPVTFVAGRTIDRPYEAEVVVRVQRSGVPFDLPLLFQATPQAPVIAPARIELTVASPRTSFVVRRGAHPVSWNTLQARLVSGGEALRIDQPVAEGPLWRVAVSTDISGWSGIMLGRIEIACLQDGAAVYSSDVTAMVRCAGNLNAHPESVLFSAVPSRGMALSQTQISSDKHDVVQATVTRVSDPRCTAVFDAKSGLLTLTFRADEHAGPANGWVELAVGAERLRIPYIAAISSADVPVSVPVSVPVPVPVPVSVSVPVP